MEAYYVKTRDYSNEFIVRRFPDEKNQVPLFKRLHGREWSRDDQSRTVKADNLSVVRLVEVKEIDSQYGALPDGVIFKD